jgi:hypothetical protein
LKGTGGKRRQCRSPDDLAGDPKQNLGGGKFPMTPRLLGRTYISRVEIALFTGSRLSNPNSALTPYDHPLGSGCVSPRTVPKLEEGGEEDGIPVSIKKSFKELRSVKDELERQVRLPHLHVYSSELRH